MGKRWRVHPHDGGRVERLERMAGVPAVVAQLLLCRGLDDPDQVPSFLAASLQQLHDPEELPGVSAAADAIYQAVQAGRRIVVYGDYDADGMSATALLWRCLKLLAADVHFYVPNRLDEGYGLNDEALHKLADTGTALIVSVDCGIASVAEAQTARELGMDLVITDHHEFACQLPQAEVVVHPRLPGTGYPFGELCGAGVAFKLAWAICRRASNNEKVTPRLRDFLIQSLGLVAIGTVADVVPLVGENRVLVKQGLKWLRESPPRGLAELMMITGLDQRRSLNSEDIAFTLGPRLNAAGRLGQAQLGVELLVTDSAERASSLAHYIHELNSNRDTLERSIFLSAHRQAREEFDPENDAALVLAGAGWHPGVIGIVAGRLAERYHRPVVMIAMDELGVRPATGSARSVPGFNIHQALTACREHLLGHGGHAAAAGLKIHESNVTAFRVDFCDYASRTLSAEDRVAEVWIDAEVPLSQLSLKTVEQLELLAPFGAGNPRPLLCAMGVTLAGPPQRMGANERHLAAKLSQYGTVLRAVAFGQAEWADEWAQLNGPLDVAFRPVINDFRGQRRVELHLVDWRPAAAPAPSSPRSSA